MFFSKLETFIAFRYLRSRRKESFISLSAWFSLIGITLGVATLIVVMSVMNGFRTELVNRILGINGHLMIYSQEANYISDYNQVIKKIINFKDVVAVTPQIEGQALARSKDYISGVILRGVRWSDLPSKKLLWNSLSKQAKYNYEKKDQLILGYRLASKLNVKIGEKITLFSANGIETAFGIMPQKQTFKIGGFFNIGMFEYDNNFIFIPWKKAQSFLIADGKTHNLEIFLKDHNKSFLMKNLIKEELEDNLIILDWKSKNSTFINALNVEKNVMFLILSLIILVAAFNIISSMIMLVNTKRSDIALLRTMGASKLIIVKIFLLIGTSIGFLGTILGTMIGLYLSLNIETVRKFLSMLFNQDLFSPEIYFLTHLPSEIKSYEILYVILTSLTLTLLASIFPAWKASSILPAETLRYE